MGQHVTSTHEMLKALENRFGRNWVITLYEDFLETEAYESVGFITASLTSAYRSLSDPMWKGLVRAQFDINK